MDIRLKIEFWGGISRPLDMLDKAKRNKFVFYAEASILPQIKIAVDSIEKKDYDEYLKYLHGVWIGAIEATPAQKENALKLYELLHNDNQIGINKKITYQQENISNYLYMLVSNTGILKDYMKFVTAGNATVKDFILTPKQRRNISTERQRKNKALWKVLFDKAVLIAPAYSTKAIDVFARPLDAVSKNLYHVNEKALQDGFMNITEKVKRSNAVSRIEFTNVETLNVKGIKSLSSFDMFIHDVCIAIQDAGNEVTTVNRIYWTMRGIKNRTNKDTRPTEAMRAAILGSVIKLSQFGISIDAGDIVKKYKIEGKNSRFISVLLPCEILSDVYLNGNVLDDVIRFTGTSPLKRNALLKDQMRSYDINLLEVPVSTTAENLPVVHYLLGCIESMKKTGNRKGKARSNVISIDTLIDKLQITERRDRLAKIIEKCLESWKGRFISDYTLQKDGHGKLVSIKIDI